MKGYFVSFDISLSCQYFQFGKGFLLPIGRETPCLVILFPSAASFRGILGGNSLEFGLIDKADSWPHQIRRESVSASFEAILDEHEKALKKALDAAKESLDAWAGGPMLEDYLSPAGADYLSNLLSLVGQDLDMRLARGMNLSAASYVERFPAL